MRSIGRKGTVRAMHILKIAGITLAIIIVLFVLSLFELWTQLARYQSYWTRQNKSAEGDITYVALGDSTAQAIGASHPSKGYVGIISKQLAEERGTTVKTINLSKSGAKIKDALNTQLPAMEKLGVTDQTVVTIEIGANDIISFDPIEFELQMDELMERLPRQTVMSDIPYFGGTRFKSKQPQVDQANVIMYKLAKKHDRALVPLHDAVKNNGGLTTLAPDHFHPSNKSYRENWAPLYMDRLK